MSIQAPPTLLELAGRSLLMDNQQAILALEDLPIELFPPLFMEAFTRGHTEVLKEMVQAWPFTCLPLGALMKEPHLGMLQVALEGLDMLLAQRDRPRRWRLQVLDLRNAHQNFWRMWTGNMADACSSEAKNKNQTLKLPTMVAKEPLKVFIDVCLTEGPLDEFQTHLYLWVKQRRDVLHLCCKKLTFFAKPNCHTRKFLKILDLNAVQKVEVHCSWKLSTLAVVAPFLGHMRNLRTLLLSHIRGSASTSSEKKERLIAQFTSQCLRMDCLQKFYANAVFFLEGHLDQVLRHLKNPLKTLSITNCQLSDSDWHYLSQYPNTSQLKLLDLRGVELTTFSPEPLRILLEKVAATLKTLDLEDCEITDSQLQALLPALSCCSQLKTFSFFGNHISMPVMRELLCRTARLSLLGLELYPAPLESYDAHGAIHLGRFSQLCAELTAIVRDVRESKLLVFSTTPCPQCGHQLLYNLGLGRCSCPAPA
ncbi:PRAME family member 12 [Sciurus carolinensis]|uniref:PRAME family member 12 n=1 Tax=Sciurus carolinensis TaxID=30640 RepID=A0AA41N3K4_SCICA|nr:PRAME family member 12-like [Sciurus carolinensis]MBZ3882777.1 PRAME family member 12 [Sciurus carolinensis]